MQVSRDEFYKHLRSLESVHNTASTCLYDPEVDKTYWAIGKEWVGYSDGKLGSNPQYHIYTGDKDNE